MNRFAFKCSLLGVCLALGVTAGAQTAAPAKTQTAAQNKAALARYDSRQIGGQNMARFRNPKVDALSPGNKLIMAKPGTKNAV